jgi:hypothetical protein
MKDDVIIEGICKMKKNRITIVNQHPPSIDFADGVELLKFYYISWDIDLGKTEDILQICAGCWGDGLYILYGDVGYFEISLLDAILFADEFENLLIG